MRFLTLYTPKANAGGPADQEHMARMGAYMDKMFKSGALLATGGLLPAAVGDMRARLESGAFTVANGPGPGPGSQLMTASGFALLQAASRDELLAMIKEFLGLAGDGACEIIELMAPPTL